MQTRSLVVSLHDVSPLTQSASEAILTSLNQIGIRQLSILIIPNHHHQAPICTDKNFSSWTSKWCSPPDREPVLHGYHHIRKPKPHEPLPTKLITQIYTSGEGEFFDISYHSARQLLALGHRDLLACNLHPTGFIAPAWLLGKEAERAVFDEGFSYTTRLSSISTSTTHTIKAHSLVWSVRSPWRRITSLAWNATIFAITKNQPLLRIAIHPVDWNFPSIRSQILRLCQTALARRQTITYQNFISHLSNPS